MERAPEKKEIREWLLRVNPLGLFASDEDLAIQDIDPKPWSGHFNFLISTGERKMVLRFKGPEWGTPGGVSEEFIVLSKVEPFAVGPKVFFHTDDFFGEPAVLMEYLSGVLATDIPTAEKTEMLWQDIARFIVRINEIPFSEDSFPFREPMTDYEKHKKAWTERARAIAGYSETRKYGEEITRMLPVLFKRLDDFTPLLQRMVEKHGASFIFESAHAGHLMKVSDGFRFLNWEQVSFGDPSFMLAVFLISIHGEPDFEHTKETMLRTYLSERPIGDFEKLLEQRLWERSVSNALYSLWISIRQNQMTGEVFKDHAGAEEKMRAIKKLLREITE